LRRKHSKTDEVVLVGLGILAGAYCLFGAIIDDVYVGPGRPHLHGFRAWSVTLAVLLCIWAVWVRELSRTTSTRRKTRHEMLLLAMAFYVYIAGYSWRL
jgi:hypothetical protein